METNKQNAKSLFYISRIIYPSYNPFWFIFYMYLVYFKIIKRKLTYTLKPISYQLILKYLRSKTNLFFDVNNTIIVYEKNLYKCDTLLKLFSMESRKSRTVYVAPSAVCKKDTILVSYTLYHNLTNSGYVTSLRLLNSDEKFIKFAEEIDVSLINSPYDITNFIIDTLLESYFRVPKLVNKGDILEINIKDFAKDVFFVNNKVNNVGNVYFKCNRIIYDKYETELSCFCVIGETAIKQSANIQTFIPKILNFVPRVLNNETSEEYQGIPLCPYGLQTYWYNINSAIKPFLNRKLHLKPVFLLQGNMGSGKEILLSSVAQHLGIHFYKINNTELLANVYAQNETKLRNAFFNVKMAAPCLISIQNFENFGKNNEGQYDERIMEYFVKELDTLFEKNLFPLFLFCCSNEKNIPAQLKKVFLETFEIKAPNTVEREENLRWILEEKGLSTNVNLTDIANKTHGFFFEDLRALVYYSEMNFKKQIPESNKISLNEENFQTAIDYMQTNYNESIGAPKVPKVEWSDVGGLNDVKEEIIKTINLPLKHPDLVKKSGLKRSGILLFGPPGTGKTLIAKAVATECSLCFLSVKGPELLNMYVGQSEQNIREVFERARQASPCIIFFDELDSLAPNRGMSGDSGGVMDRVVSQLLAEMDGLNESATVFIIGATNRPDLIDPALLRPGRFDKLLYVGPCTDEESKLSVLKALTRRFNLEKEVNLSEVVRICPNNVTGADFYGICSNAWSSAVRKLINNVEKGNISVENVNHEDVLVSFEDFKMAIENVKPSIRPEDIKYFEKLKNELGANI